MECVPFLVADQFKDNITELEKRKHIFLNDSWDALLYAKTINGRFEEGEPIIAEYSYCSAEYALNIIKSRFPLGEKVMSDYHTLHSLAYFYKYHKKTIAFAFEKIVLLELFDDWKKNNDINRIQQFISDVNERVPELEEYIANNFDIASHYSRDIIKGRFELFEKALIKAFEDSVDYHYNKNFAAWRLRNNVLYYASNYAITVLKGRFEEVEKYIATDAVRSLEYAQHALKGKFELGEEIIAEAKDIRIPLKYALRVLKGKFDLAHTRLLRSYNYKYYYKTFLGLPTDGSWGVWNCYKKCPEELIPLENIC